MKKRVLFWVFVATAYCGYAQEIKDFTYKIYGQARTDLLYNSRDNVEGVDGLVYKYPKNVALDADGKDLNDNANSNAYVLYTRLGIDLKGPDFMKAKTSIKMEVDFRGQGTTYNLFRVRHAYFNLDWKQSSLLVGQTWHPMQGEVLTQILNLNSGQPFQPFSRTPQVRYRHRIGAFQLTGATVWQMQYTSAGPEGKSNVYLKNATLPECYAGVDYKTQHWLVGAGLELFSMVPRTQSVWNDNVYAVNERITTLSYEAHLKYVDDFWNVTARTTLGSNHTQTSMNGGFGVKSIDERTGKQEYTPIRESATWLNVTYGKKWRPSIYLAYCKNLGTPDAIDSSNYGVLYGSGTDVDKLSCALFELTYNIPHWKIGAEYSYTSAWYGDLNKDNGKIIHSESVGNHRLVVSAMFMF